MSKINYAFLLLLSIGMFYVYLTLILVFQGQISKLKLGYNLHTICKYCATIGEKLVSMVFQRKFVLAPANKVANIEDLT